MLQITQQKIILPQPLLSTNQREHELERPEGKLFGALLSLMLVKQLKAHRHAERESEASLIERNDESVTRNRT